MLKTINQNLEECLGAVNQPQACTAKCDNHGETTCRSRKKRLSAIVGGHAEVILNLNIRDSN